MTNSKRKSWRRWGGGVLIALATSAGIIAYKDYVLRQDSETELAAATAELDAQFPDGWRYDVVFGRRPAAPEPNAALAVPELDRAIPQNWSDDTLEELRQAPPPVRPDPHRLAHLRQKLKALEAPLATCRRFADRGDGRILIDYQPNYYATLLPDVQATRKLVSLLAFDALARAEDGDASGALADCRAGLNVARWMRDEPAAIVQLVRIALSEVVGRTVERVLAQSEPSPELLAQLQQISAADETVSPYPLTVAGELALSHRFYESVAAGLVYVHEIGDNRPANLWQRFSEVPFRRYFIGKTMAYNMRHYARAATIARLPLEQQRAGMQLFMSEFKADEPSDAAEKVARLLIIAHDKLLEAGLRYYTGQRCLQTILAAERFRRDRGRWPASLDELVPRYLPAVPTDPFDGRPLRLKRTDDGLVVYSIGLNEADDGGVINRQNANAPGTDLGYQLWDVAKRRQPPPPAPPKPTPEDQP